VPYQKKLDRNTVMIQALCTSICLAFSEQDRDEGEGKSYMTRSDSSQDARNVVKIQASSRVADFVR
jgi:hypothetical protein